MKGWTTLLKGNLILKLLTLVLFAIIARLFETEEIVIYALIPSLSIVFVSLSGFGILTVCEKYVPTCNDSLKSELILGAVLLQSLGLLVLGSVFYCSFDYWVSKGFMPADWANYKSLVCLSIFLFALNNVQLIILNILGKFRRVNNVRILFESLNKILPITAVLLFDGDVIVMYLAAQVLTFVVSINYIRQEVSFTGVSLKPILKKIAQYPYLYIESVFNAFRNVGDNLVVSAVLGDSALSIYYVLKRAAEQIEPLGSAILKASAPHFSKLKNVEVEERNKTINTTLEAYAYGCFQTGILYAPVCVVVLYLVAGQQYVDHYASSILLVVHYALLICTSMALKVVLNFSNAMYRFVYVSVSFLMFCAVFVFLLSDYGVLGAAASLVLVDIFMLAILGGWLLSLGVKMMHWIGLVAFEVVILSVVLGLVRDVHVGISYEFFMSFLLLSIVCASLVWFCTTKYIKRTIELKLRNLVGRAFCRIKG